VTSFEGVDCFLEEVGGSIDEGVVTFFHFNTVVVVVVGGGGSSGGTTTAIDVNQ